MATTTATSPRPTESDSHLPGTAQRALPTSRPVRRRSLCLFSTLLALVLLTQVVVLRWGAETVFFLTWLFLALTVRHDSRLSAAVGLAFLATCPFLLIAEKEPVAEQAANYAYFFLAIGVLVQLEELLLERHGWPECKLDLSYLWRPPLQSLRRRWSAAARAVGRQLAAADRTELLRLVQVVGTLGLAVVFVWSALSGARPAVVLPLLGGALLFPFLVWGLRQAVRALGAAWVLRAALALAILPLAAAELVWLHDLVAADRMACMATAYDFVEQREQARRTSPPPEGEVVEARVWTIDDVSRRVLYQHPAFAGASRIGYPVHVGRGALLSFAVATAPESWLLPGDGAAFAVYVEADGITEQLFATYVDPKHDEADRRWHAHTVDLAAYAGRRVTITFETGTGPAGDYRYDWAGWGTPRVLER
jgi:hypothetical protein